MKRRKTSINLEDSSESEENYTLDSVDRFSALPDSVLSDILSFLPTKNAVASSVLSKRWKFVWRTVRNLDFCNIGCLTKQPDEGEVMKFVEFVNRVLLLHDSGILNKFRLVWTPECIFSHATSWISTAIARNVHELIVCVKPFVPRIKEPELFEVPISVFSCDSLRSLDLSNDVYFSDAIVVSLPRLESLRLSSVVFESEEAFERLIKGCPMLNYLYLYMDIRYMSLISGYDNFTYIISSTSLRRLEASCISWTSEPREADFGYNLVLEASSLEYLKVEGFNTQIFVKNNLSSLVEANFNIRLLEYDLSQDNVCNSLVEAVRALECAKAISLSGDVMWALSRATISLSTEFKRLVKLKTQSHCCYTSSLREFIQTSDNLEALTVIQVPNPAGKIYPHDHSKWAAPLEVPSCLSNCLKEVVLNGYSGFDDEREMICYMLKNGSALEVMRIGVYSTMDDNKMFELLQEICRFPRKSTSCEVEFNDLSSPIMWSPESSNLNSNTWSNMTSEEESVD